MNDTEFINQFESAVAMAVKTGDMPAPGACVVAALSGGADSVALTVALHRLGYRVTAVHCNYHLRGEESNRDARSAEDLCRRLTIPLRSFDFDVEARRKSTGESIEMACRELRYDVFARVLSETDSEAVAVGHHREDNIETFFINLLRGSGLRGLTGMRPWDTVRRVMRPLLGLTRGDIERYLNTLGVEWVDDSSNASNDYRRNKLRNVVMPALRSMFPDCEERISASLALLGANRTLYESMCGELSGRFVSEKGVDVKAVKEVYMESNESINESPAETYALCGDAEAGTVHKRHDVFDEAKFAAAAEFSRSILVYELACRAALDTHLILDTAHIDTTVTLVINKHGEATAILCAFL